MYVLMFSFIFRPGLSKVHLQPSKFTGWYPINLSELKLGRHHGVGGDQKKNQEKFTCASWTKKIQKEIEYFSEKIFLFVFLFFFFVCLILPLFPTHAKNLG